MDDRAKALRRALLQDRADGLLYDGGDWTPLHEELSGALGELVAGVSRASPEDADPIVRDLRGLIVAAVIDRC
jgi:hypothetical protein